MKRYLQLVLEKKSYFDYFNILQMLRIENQVANKLARAILGMEKSPLPPGTISRNIEIPVIDIEVMEVRIKNHNGPKEALEISIWASLQPNKKKKKRSKGK